MPSRDSAGTPSARLAPAWRVALEWALRAFALAFLVLLLLRALDPVEAAESTEATTSPTLGRALEAWTRRPPARAAATLDSVPTPAQRDWMAALMHAGVALTWDGAVGSPTALSVTTLPDPAGAWEIDAAAGRDTGLALRDGLGMIDSLRVTSTRARVVVPRIVRGVEGRSSGARASAPVRDSVIIRRVLVEGAAGWETRFTVVALQERGWSVDALMHVAPNVDVRVGSPTAPDTARYALAIAVDTSAHLIAGAASSFVRSGGGLVTLHDAAGLGPSGAGSVVLERRSDGEVRGSRFGAGRVLRVSYPELWRMRMAGGDSIADPAARHRDWLARAAASVAYAPRVTVHTAWPDDPAPYSDLVARVGPPTTVASRDGGSASSQLFGAVPDSVLAALLLLSLLGEWLSRRLRGAR